MILKLAKKINKSKNFVRKKTSKSSWQPTLKKKITDTNHKHHKKICIRNIIESIRNWKNKKDPGYSILT
jgi:hypothetical protein